MKNYSFILLSGGIGTRMQNEIPKQHILLAGKPIIMYAIEYIDKLETVNQVVITCPEKYIEELKQKIINYNLRKDYQIIKGGDTRQESVYLALQKVTNKAVILHESARPFANVEDFNNLISEENENVTYGIELPFTVLKKNEESIITGNLRRSDLVNIQLPQKFNTELLKKAHVSAIANNNVYTEDASLIFEELNEKVHIIRGKDSNIKITTPLDYKLAEIIHLNKTDN